MVESNLSAEIKVLKNRITFLEDLNRELQATNMKICKRAMAAERDKWETTCLLSDRPLVECFADMQPEGIASEMLSDVADYFAITLAQANEKAWEQLFTYCPLPVMEKIYVKKKEKSYLNLERADSKLKSGDSKYMLRKHIHENGEHRREWQVGAMTKQKAIDTAWEMSKRLTGEWTLLNEDELVRFSFRDTSKAVCGYRNGDTVVVYSIIDASRA
jgi:hypothetical protein